MSDIAVKLLTLEDASELLYREAYLLDHHQFDAWLDLYTADATYWLPLEHNQPDPVNTSSLVYDDRRLMELRIKQAKHPRAHARVPAARTVHQVGNVMLLEQGGGDAKVASVLALTEFRGERQRMFAALVEHRLRMTPAGWKIAAKRVDLTNSEGELDGIAVIF
jgi:3-phenylpropionate/cinnamic acid dioxygenase small subunit